MKTIIKTLMSYKDDKYAEFTLKLTPGLTREKIIGVRVPTLRQYGKELVKTGEYKEFIKELPHKYYEENLLHSIILCNLKDYDEIIDSIEKFMPYIDNWAVSDTISPKVFSKHKDKLIKKIKQWLKNKDVYSRRVAIDQLMNFYLDDDFKEEYLELPAKIKTEEYYLRMMIAWFYATALAKQYSATIPYLENNILDVYTHNKTIQKAIESFRISDSQKEYLKTLRRKVKDEKD